MQCNVGGVDRTLRFAVGVAIMGAGFYFGSWWGIIGLIVFLTAVFSRCPVYIPFGISTYKVTSSETPATPANDSTPQM